MKPLCALIFVLIYSLPVAYSQSMQRSTVGNSGSSHQVISNGKTYFVSQSIGQASVNGTSIKKGHAILQGFQQPPFFSVDQRYVDGDLKATIFPNPFQQSVFISFKELIENDVSVIIHDISGRFILKETFSASQLISLPLSNTSDGEYILNIITGNMHLTSILIKQ